MSKYLTFRIIVHLGASRSTCGGRSTRTLGKASTTRFQKFVDNPQQCFAFAPQAHFPVHNFNFH